MSTKIVTDSKLLNILSKLEPDEDLDGSLRKLLTRRARNDLLRYQLTNEKFAGKYGMNFKDFKGSEMMKKPLYPVEQDYFDWEMAITMIDDLEEVLDSLQGPSV